VNGRSLFLLGLGVLAAAWFSPLLDLVPGSFSRHMAMHMAVVAVAAPLLSFGLASGRFDPVRRAPALFPPVPLSVVELIAVWAWHTPALHHHARHTTSGLVLEQATFVLSGVLVWLSAFGGPREARHERRAAGVVSLLLTSMHMTLLGALLALPPRPLYAHAGHAGHAGHAEPLLDALADQHLGGAIMLIVGGVSYLAGGLWLTAQFLRPRLAPKTGSS
jgi:putative membrane protein